MTELSQICKNIIHKTMGLFDEFDLAITQLLRATISSYVYYSD